MAGPEAPPRPEQPTLPEPIPPRAPPPQPEPEQRPLHLAFPDRADMRPGLAKIRTPAGWEAVPVSGVHAEKMEQAAGARGPMADLCAAMNRRRWRQPGARLAPKSSIRAVARKYGIAIKVVEDMARRLARDIPPSRTAAGKHAIQSSRGKASGSARRAAAWSRDVRIVALLDTGAATVRQVAAECDVSPSTVATARERLKRVVESDDRQWAQARKIRRRAVKQWWRRHYRTCERRDCTCRDHQRRAALEGDDDGAGERARRRPARAPNAAETRRYLRALRATSSRLDRRTLPPNGGTTCIGAARRAGHRRHAERRAAPRIRRQSAAAPVSGWGRDRGGAGDRAALRHGAAGADALDAAIVHGPGILRRAAQVARAGHDDASAAVMDRIAVQLDALGRETLTPERRTHFERIVPERLAQIAIGRTSALEAIVAAGRGVGTPGGNGRERGANAGLGLTSGPEPDVSLTKK